MADLPARPSLDHLRHEARDLLRAAQSGGTAAADRIRKELADRGILIEDAKDGSVRWKRK